MCAAGFRIHAQPLQHFQHFQPIQPICVQDRMIVRESYSRALEQGPLRARACVVILPVVKSRRRRRKKRAEISDASFTSVCRFFPFRSQNHREVGFAILFRRHVSVVCLLSLPHSSFLCQYGRSVSYVTRDVSCDETRREKSDTRRHPSASRPSESVSHKHMSRECCRTQSNVVAEPYRFLLWVASFTL